jgi:divalent metal cation (Fe/Co/Zn/Cd) transporter
MADRRHSFGHGRNVYFWAFVVAVILFTLGGAFSIWEAVRKFLHGGEHGEDTAPARADVTAFGVAA